MPLRPPEFRARVDRALALLRAAPASLGAAIEGLGAVGRDVEQLVCEHRGGERGIMFLLRSEFDKAVRALQSSKPAERQSGLCRLAATQDPRARPHFRLALEDTDALCRYFAVHGLLALGAASSLAELETALAKEPDALNRLWLRVALIASGRRGQVALLGDEITTVDDGGREDWDSAPGIVEHLGTEPAVDELGALLDHPNGTARWIAVMALDQIGTTEAMAHIRRAAEDADAHVREEAISALQRLHS